MAPSVLLPIWKKKKKFFHLKSPNYWGAGHFHCKAPLPWPSAASEEEKPSCLSSANRGGRNETREAGRKKKKRAQTVAETPRAKRRSNRLKKTENEPGEGGASGGLELGKGFRFFFFPVGAQRPITTGVRNISFRPASIVWRTKKKKIVYGESLLTGKKKKLRFPAPLGSPAARPALAGWPGAAGRFFFFFFFFAALWRRLGPPPKIKSRPPLGLLAGRVSPDSLAQAESSERLGMAGKKFSRAARRRDISHRNYWGAKHFVSSCIDCMANEKKKKISCMGRRC